METNNFQDSCNPAVVCYMAVMHQEANSITDVVYFLIYYTYIGVFLHVVEADQRHRCANISVQLTVVENRNSDN